MKAFLIVLGVLFLVIVVSVGHHFYSENQAEQAMKLAQADIDKQFADRWQTVIQSYDMLFKSCSSKLEYKDFCRSHYKSISELVKFEVDPKFAGALQPQVEVFADKVIYPAKDLFNLMSDPITADPEQPKDITRKAKELEANMSQYWETHRQLEPVSRKAKDLKVLLNKIYQVKPPEATKIVIVNTYPDWVTTNVQRQAFSSMRNIASRYFAARASLNRQLNWTYGRNNSSYFGYSDVRTVLAQAIELRRNLFAEVQDAKKVEGMSELADKLETMLRNSYQGLLGLYNDQDYRTFKQLNNENDQISRYVRQVFGIR